MSFVFVIIIDVCRIRRLGARSGYRQDGKKITSKKKPQSYYFAGSRLDDRQFKSIINEEFGTLMGSQSRSDIGNFAGLDLKEAPVSFSGKGQNICKQNYISRKKNLG